MFFSELYKIMVKKVAFIGFKGPIAPPPGPAPASVFLVLFFFPARCRGLWHTPKISQKLTGELIFGL